MLDSKDNYPLYTKEFMCISDLYIKNGEILKNRHKTSDRTLKESINMCKTIVYEIGSLIIIHCSEDRKQLFNASIERLKNYNSRISVFYEE